MKSIKVIYGQTMEDIALRYYGCVEGLVTLMADNKLNADDLLFAGQQLLIQDEVPELTSNNRAMAEALENAGIIPNTGMSAVVPSRHYVESGYVALGYVE